LNKIQYIIKQRVAVTDTKELINAFKIIETSEIFQEGMFLKNGIKENNLYEELQIGMVFDDGFYHRDYEAKITKITKIRNINSVEVYVNMEDKNKPMRNKKYELKLLKDHGWEIPKEPIY